MSIPCKTERSLLDFEEFSLVRNTHHPAIYELSEADLIDTQARLRKIRDRERTLARQKRREVRGKAEERGGSFPGTAEHPRRRKMVFSSALKRVNREIKRLRKLAARTANVEAAQRALAMHRAAKFVHHPTSKPVEGDDFQPIPSRRRRYKVPPWRIGSISQHTKTSQAIKDARPQKKG